MATACDSSSRTAPASLFIAINCVFLTGLAALVYEICWIRKASLVFGSTTWSVSAVLAIFFAGLGSGSFIAGRYSRRMARPLRVCAWLEVGVFAAAVLSPTVFTLTDMFYGVIYPYGLHSRWCLPLLRLVGATIVILPATMLMGGNLPLFCRQFVQQQHGISRGVGLLYAFNTLGAAAGSAACGFWLIPNVGVNVSIYLAGALNLVVGLIAFRLSTGPALEFDKSDRETDDSSENLDAQRSQRTDPTILAYLFFGVGFVGLAQEVLWTRYLSLWMPNTIHTYTFTLTTVLLGIMVGSLLAASVPDRLRFKAGLFGTAQVGSGLAVMVVMQLRPAWWGEWLSPVSIGQQLGVVMVVMLVPAVLSGFSFPLAVRLVVRDVSQTGSGVGRMAAINMFGGIAGSLVVGFLLLPRLGMQFSLFFTTGLSLAIGVVACWQLERGLSGRLRASFAAVSVLVWVAIPYLCQTKLPQDFLAIDGKLVDYREGIGANVSVVRKGTDLRLQINRMWQGQDRKNHQAMAAHIPALLHGNPESVLVIGLGTGQTARSFLVHDINRLDCLEVEDTLIDLVERYFESDWMKDPRVRLLVEDGRNYVTHTREQYDLISIEVGQIYRPRVASFYTAEFYERLRSRLRPDGLVCQFLPIEFFRPGEFKTLVATFVHAFPESVLWYNTSELLLIGSRGQQITLSSERLTNSIATNRSLKQAMDYAYWGGTPYYLSRPEVFAAGFLCGSEELQTLSKGGAVYRDDRPYLEYITLLRRPGAPDTVTLLRRHLSPFTTIFGDNGDGGWASSLTIRRQNLQEIIARTAVNRGQSLQAEGRVQEAAFEYGQALEEMPSHPQANLELGVILQSQGQYESAISCYRRALTTRPNDLRTLYNLAVALAFTGKTDQAQARFRQVLTMQPNHAKANYFLGTLLQEEGRLTEAAECYRRSLRSDPNNSSAHVNLAGTLLARGQPADSILHYQAAARLDPLVPNVHVRLGAALAMAGRLEPALGAFQEALRLQPDLARAHLGIGDVLLSSGRWDRAAEAYREAIALDSNLVEAHIGLAYALQNSGQLTEGLEHFRNVLQLAPDNLASLRAAAWILATHPDASERDPKQAVAWGEHALQLTGQQDPQVLDVLAAAYAAEGQFERAVQLAELAMQLANGLKMFEFSTRVRQRLSLYREGKPFVQ